MLQSIREHTHGWIAGFIVSLLILSFALWGIHSYFLGAGASNIVAKVNDTEITKNQLSVAYERLRRQLQMQLNSAQLPPGSETRLKEDALKTLLNLQVLEQASTSENYRISSEQVENFLQTMPDFQNNGKFSIMRFQQVLSANLFNVPDFFNFIRTTLLIEQPRLGILLSSFSTSNEVDNLLALVEQTRHIQYLLVPQQYFSNQTINISSEDIHAYYMQHQDEYKTPEQVSIEYILLSAKDLANKMHPTDEQLKNFYNENMSAFAKSGQPNSFEKVKDQVQATFVRQKSEEEFAAQQEKMASLTYEHPDSLQRAAQELKIPVSTTELFTKEKGEKDLTSNAKVREIAFGNDVLTLQNNSDVIQINPEEVVVLRIKKHVPATLLPIEQVQNQILAKLRTKVIEEKLLQLATEIKNKLQAGTLSPTQVSEQYHLTWNNAGFVGRHTAKMDQAILTSAFEMPKSKNNQPSYTATKVANGFVVIALLDVKSADTAHVAKEQYQAFAEQIQNSQGILEYELYKNTLMKQAKIKIENQ